MDSSFPPPHLRRNPNRERFPVSATGMAKWPGIARMGNRRAARHCHTRTVINHGGSAVSTATSLTRSPAKTRCLRPTASGRCIRRVSRRRRRSCCITPIRDSPAPHPTSSLFSADPVPGKEPCASWPSCNSDGLTYPPATCSARNARQEVRPLPPLKHSSPPESWFPMTSS